MENIECEYTKLKEKIQKIDNWFSSDFDPFSIYGTNFSYELLKDEWTLIKKYVRKPTLKEIAEMKGLDINHCYTYKLNLDTGEEDVY